MRRLKSIAGILMTALREIFDEASYARFLERTHRASSPETYSEFWREREGQHARRPKCC